MILYSGEENGIVIEASGENSIFSEQYSQAHTIIDGMIRQAEFVKNQQPGERANTIGSTPNIVAFCGDRGEGKTSCMESVVLQLRKNHDDNLIFMNTIDPAFFDNNHNVIEILLGLMFRDFHKRREEQKNAELTRLGRELTKDEEIAFREKQKKMSGYFQSARQCLREMYEDRDVPFDALDKLTNMVQGISLHEKLEELFEEYLKYCGNKSYDNMNNQIIPLIKRIASNANKQLFEPITVS